MPSLKRKRGGDDAEGTAKSSSSSKTSSKIDALDVFRRHFESQFGAVKGLNAPVKPATEEESNSDDSDDGSDDEENGHDDEWTGIGGEAEVDDMRSDDDFESDDLEEPTPPSNTTRLNPTVQVVEYSSTSFKSSSTPIVRASRREFMSSKPPRTSSTSTSTTKSSKTKTSSDEEEDDKNDLKNDVDLQRLLRESHLLDGTTLSHASGKNRHVATELRIQSLGGKALKTFGVVPMNISKGVSAKAVEREKKRRVAAREAGVVLEKEKRVKKRDAVGKRRDRGVGNPGVGKFRRGALVLSKRDVAEMTGPDKKRGGKKGGKGKKRR